MNTSDFIKKRNEEFEKKFEEHPTDEIVYATLDELKSFHSVSLNLFAEEIKKEIEKMKISFPDYKNEDNRGREAMRVAWNTVLSDLAKMLEI